MDIVQAIREMHQARANWVRLYDLDERTEQQVADMEAYGDAMAEKWEAISGWLGHGGWSPIAKDWRYRP